MDQELKNYEGMFLLDAGQPNFETASEPVRTVLERAEAQVLSIKPWDERKLAYEIEGRRRGLYVLTYFKADPSRISELEHDCRINEQILRVLILRHDQITDEQLRAETPATQAARRAAQAAEREKQRAAQQEAEKQEAQQAASGEKESAKETPAESTRQPATATAEESEKQTDEAKQTDEDEQKAQSKEPEAPPQENA